MSKLIEIQSHGALHLVHHGFAATWSENDQIAMITEKGVQILELRYRPHNRTPSVDCQRSAVGTHAHAPTAHMGIDATNILHSACELGEVTALLLNPDWAPELDKTSAVERVLVQTVWSPRGLVHYARCLLACLTNMGQLTLYGADREQWVIKFDISKMWLHYFRKKWSKPYKTANMKHQITELQYRASRIKFTAVAWERFQGDEFSCSTLLFTASQDGIIALWIVEDENFKSGLNLEPITVSISNSLRVKLMKIFDSKLTHITSFLWCSTDSQTGVLIAGNVKGAINSICVNFCETSKSDVQQVTVKKPVSVSDVASFPFNDQQNLSGNKDVALEMQKTDLLQANSGCLDNLTSGMEPNLQIALSKMETERRDGGLDNQQPNLTSRMKPNLESAISKMETESRDIEIMMDLDRVQADSGGTGTKFNINLTSAEQPGPEHPNLTFEEQLYLSSVPLTSEAHPIPKSVLPPNLTFEEQLNLSSVPLTSEAHPIPNSVLPPNLTSHGQPDLTSEPQSTFTSKEEVNPTFEAQTNLTSQLQSNPPSNVEIESNPKAQPDLTSVAQPNLTSVAQPDLTSVAQPYLTSVAQPDLTSVAQPDLTLVAQPNLTSVAQSDPTSVAQPDLTSVAQPNLTSVAQPNITSVPQPNLTSVAQPNLTSVAQPELTSVVQPNLTSVPQPNLTSVAQPNLTSVAQPNLTSVAQPNTTSVAQPDLTSLPQPNLTSVAQPNLTSVAQPDLTSVPQPNLTSVAQPNLTSVPQPNLTSVAQPNLTSVPQPNLTSVAQPDLTSVPQPNLTSVSQPNLTSVAQPNLTSVPQPELTSVEQPYLTSVPQPNLTSVAQPYLTSVSQPNLTPVPQPPLTSGVQTDLQQPDPTSHSPTGNIAISIEPLWPEEDLLSVSSLICWDADNSNVCAVCIKGTHIIVLILQKGTGKLVSKHCHNTRRCNLTGLIKLNNAAFLIGCQQGAIFKLTLVQDDNGEVTFLNETVHTNFIKNRYGVMGLAASRNRAFIAVNVSLNGPYDRSKLKTLSSFVICSFENAEIDPMAVVNSKNFVSLDRIWDCLEYARLNILQKSIIYIVPPTIREQLDTMDINPLIITMWLTNFVAYSLQLEQIENGTEFSTENKSQTMARLYDEIRLLVFASHIFQRCTLLLSSSSSSSSHPTSSSSSSSSSSSLHTSSSSSSSSSEFNLLSLRLMRQWISAAIVANATVDCHTTTKLTAESVVEQIDAYFSKQGVDRQLSEACLVCNGDVPASSDFSLATCRLGHQIPRCSLSLVPLPCNCVFLVCQRCGVLAHPAAVSGDFTACVFCHDQLVVDHNQLTETEVEEMKEDLMEKRRKGLKDWWARGRKQNGGSNEEDEETQKRKKWKKKKRK